MNDNLAAIIGIEILCAAQGIEFRAPLKTSPALQTVIHALREDISRLEDDRFMAPDLAKVKTLVKESRLVTRVGSDLGLALL